MGYHCRMEKTFDRDLFVARLRERYNTLGLIPEDLSLFVRKGGAITLKAIRSYFNNAFTKPPEIPELLALAELLQTSPDHLLGDSDAATPLEDYTYNRERFVEQLREQYRNRSLLPEDLELFAARGGFDFNMLRDILNNEYKKNPDVTVLLGFSGLYDLSPSVLLGLTPAREPKKSPGRILAAALTVPKVKNRPDRPALISGLLGGGLALAGAFSPALRQIDGPDTVVLLSHVSGILTALFGLAAIVLATLKQYRLLRWPALAILGAAGWAFAAFRGLMKPGQMVSETAWLLLGLGTFCILLSSVLEAGRRRQ